MSTLTATGAASTPTGTGAASAITVSKHFRPEIEGVRFIAAMLVAIYHVWTHRVSGGVDVFFVMSGFLITTTLLGHVNVHGRIQPLTYLGRLALRLLPAAVTTLSGVLVASWLFLPSLRRVDIGHEVRASALYVQNWYLSATDTDYLAQFDEKTPVQHFWALSLQGQFYVSWLLVFLLLVALIRRWPERAVPLVVGTLGLIFASSIAYSVWYTAADQPAAYFSTPARAWEFALGGLAAIALRHPPHGRSPLRWALGWVGLAILLTTGILLHVATVFPGYAALLPTSGALLILFAANNGIRAGADSLLSLRPLVWLGGISYGIYLWHYPMLRVYRSVRETDSNSLLSGSLIILAAIAMAYLTQVVVERPLLRFAGRSAEARRVVISGLLLAVVGVVVAATLFGANPASRQEVQRFHTLTQKLTATAYELGPCTGALAGPPGRSAHCDAVKYDRLTPPPTLVEATQHALPCDRVYQRGELDVCSGGSAAAHPRATVLLIGDSHALTMRPALDLVAQHRGWRLLFAYGAGCQTAAEPKVGVTAKRCASWMDELTRYIEQYRGGIDVLFSIQASGRELETSTGSSSTGSATKSSAYVAAYREQWHRYAGHVRQLVVIRDTPRLSTTVLDCIAMHGAAESAEDCSRPRADAVRTDYAARAAITDDDQSTGVVDLTDVFCDQRRCYPILGGFIAYRDAVHLHSVFAPTLAPLLDHRISTALTPQLRDLLYGGPALAPAAGGTAGGTAERAAG